MTNSVAMRDSKGQKRSLRRRLAIIPLAVLGLLLLIPGIVAAQQASETDIGDITGNIDQYEGQRVVVTGEVAQVIEPRAFIKREGGFLGIGASEILVIADRDLMAQIEEGREVRTTGSVGRFDFNAFQNAIGGDLSNTVYADWDGEAVLVVDTVEVVDNNGNDD
jgi:hypothetical protein